MYKLFRILGNGEVGVPFRANTAEEIAERIEKGELKHFYVCRQEKSADRYTVIMRVDGSEFYIRSKIPASLRMVYERLQKAHESEALGY
jgi:hypothetical protein